MSWTRIEDRLPKASAYPIAVLGWLKSYDHCFSMQLGYFGDGLFKEYSGHALGAAYRVTHWQPMPGGPQDGD